MITNIFNQILVYPLINLLVFFYQYIPDVGVVIVLLTVFIRLIFLPSFHKSLKHQRMLQNLQPKVDEIKKKFKDDREAELKATMELYKEHEINPLSSCLPLLVQIPILLALYHVFMQSLNGQQLQGLYSFVPNPGQIDPLFLNWLDLSKINLWLTGVAAILQYVLGLMQQPNKPQDTTARIMRAQVLYMFPVLTFIIGFRMPAGLVLYWVVTTLFGMGQQYYILRREASKAIENAK